MSHSTSEVEYTIAAVSKLTGVSCHALRVWERRYGFPVPNRSASGHRRYGIEQTIVLRKLFEMSRQGQPIGALIVDYLGGRLTIDISGTLRAQAGDKLNTQLDALLERLLEGDLTGADAVYGHLEETLPVEDVVSRVIAPVLTETGERWFRRRSAIYQERCVSVFLRRRLAMMIESAREANTHPTRRLLLGTVQGERHEGGILFAHLLLERAGWRVINLGVDLPVSEYARCVEALRPDALAVSFVLSRNINKRFQELSKLDSLPVFVGGRSILNYQGLARRYGLTPVPGPISAAVELLGSEFETWSQAGGARSRSRNHLE